MRVHPFLFVAALGLGATQSTVESGAPSVLERSIRVQYESARKYDVHALRDVDLSRKYVTVNVTWGGGDDVLVQERDALFSQVRAFYDRHGVDVHVLHQQPRRSDSHNVDMCFVDDVAITLNSGYDATSLVGFANIKKRIAFVNISRTNAARNALPRDDFVKYYANVVIHELAHLFSLNDRAMVDDLCLDVQPDNIMDQDFFRLYATGKKQLSFTPEQEVQMHSYLSCGLMYDLSHIVSERDFLDGVRIARHARLSLQELEKK